MRQEQLRVEPRRLYPMSFEVSRRPLHQLHNAPYPLLPTHLLISLPSPQGQIVLREHAVERFKPFFRVACLPEKSEGPPHLLRVPFRAPVEGPLDISVFITEG